ncbi:MAG: hypothetical protein WB660_30185 [Candidatus Sulfotelmatobacter sp.]
MPELGDEPAQVGARSAGQSGRAQRLSQVAEANEESVEEFADTDQACESSAVDGIEDAADPAERPTHTHEEYGRPDDVLPRRRATEKKISLSHVRIRIQTTTASRYSPNTRRIASEISPTVA